MKVISIALFGNSSATDGSGMGYAQYLKTFCIAHLNLFPIAEQWRLYVYIDRAFADSVQSDFIYCMETRGLVTVVCMEILPIRTKAMLWRMAPVFHDDVEYVFPRDIDSCPMPRDRAVCEQFIRSGIDVGTVHDSQSHAGIMGGLCAFHAPAFRSKTGLYSLDDLYTRANKTDAEWAEHGTDQIVLNRIVDRADGPTLLEHRYNGWHAGPGKYPAKRSAEYACEAFSTPTPNVGVSRLGADLQARADLLANHLGAAGYDHIAARAFWEEHGDPEIAELVRECEA